MSNDGMSIAITSLDFVGVHGPVPDVPALHDLRSALESCGDMNVNLMDYANSDALDIHSWPGLEPVTEHCGEDVAWYACTPLQLCFPTPDPKTRAMC